MPKHKKIIFIAFSLFLFIVIGALIIFTLRSKPLLILEDPEVDKCMERFEEKTVRGNSLSGLIEDGDEVKIFPDYYDCYEIKRGDIVLYSYAGSEIPLIKIVKGIPGDKFSLIEKEGYWNIKINGEVIKNSESKEYTLNENQYRILFLYERDYGGVIPDEAYLIMGNLVGGSMDSTRYGLIGKSKILGKVEKL